MSMLDDLRPKQKLRVMNLLREAGLNVSAWKNYKGPPAANPKYCYNWSFEQPGKFVAVCIWHRDLKLRGKTVVHTSQRKNYGGAGGSQNAAVWNRRARAFEGALELAFRQKLPVRVIIVDGAPGRGGVKRATASIVRARLLDDVPWAVTEYDYASGRRVLTRGARQVKQTKTSVDWELSWFEGEAKRRFVLHRQREGRARRAKIQDALARNAGRLICEVKNCGFDFKERYGVLGEGYAQVHHLAPLSRSAIGGRNVKLQDLAIVCANCHVMVHANGKCRPLGSLIPR
jgi:5-methylcytosine-specific restriction enzyme A